MERQLPFSFAKRHGVIVDYHYSDGVRILYRPDVNLTAIQEAQRIVEAVLPLAAVNEADFSEALNRAYQTDSDETMQMVEGLGDAMDLSSLADSVPETTDLLDQVDDAPIIRLINAILTEAVREGASDIHIETFEKRLSIRFRVDGVLREVVQPKRALAPLLVSRIKVMARLDIAEKRLPQDGRISLRVAGREVDLRVSTIPANHGERVVLRLLDKKAGRLDLGHLGLSQSDLAKFEDLISRPHGIILVTGPTGSGKTTSLYAALQSLNSQVRNIMTVEDPIEYGLQGIGQTQVNTKVDMTFARGLRAILRQDPDVVMIGEIRDLETAEIAVQASLTGHLVLSTLHTNSAVGAVTRLQDMGIEPFLLASSLIGLVSQRLVRTLCPDCKTAHSPDASERAFLSLSEDSTQEIYQANGCSACKGTGFRGRVGVYELIRVDEQLRGLIHSEAGDLELETYARKDAHSILDDGKVKVLQGITTIEEVLRVNRSY
ncbi:type II secretion system ATPase GspE [Reinekea marinisedimentorum]|uniref:Type II secretion system protein E n=1 Tax=Reinekea marinisedimentorum TaxID=230495 RepID=A0A4R3I8F5_9GAMM|nr:type II secretion system ATPase GspE [Reinekea marinisedimentorum]TCS42543.1 general secretion pathway protein E [Reinekea marinisedimentorum]